MIFSLAKKAMTLGIDILNMGKEGVTTYRFGRFQEIRAEVKMAPLQDST
jgi:hypothetical protein